MDWKKVESSQIDQVGYDEPSATLGIRFKPTKKQLAEEQPGSEYHYSNVSPYLHTQLMEAKDNPAYGSVGKYFGDIIKARPDLYPYTKIVLE